MLLATNDIGEGIIWKRKRKKYIIPEAEIIEFTEKDIVSLSGLATTLYWGDDDNTEDPTNGSNATTFVADFVANDRFIVVKRTNSLFKVWDGSCVRTNKTEPDFVNDNSKIKATTTGQFRLPLCTSSHNHCDVIKE